MYSQSLHSGTILEPDVHKRSPSRSAVSILCTYRIAENIDEELILANWQSAVKSPT